MHPNSVLLYTLLLASYVRIVAASCNATNPCPASSPCCSQYGFCGSETYCLGGCNPLASYSLDSCTPNPVCQNTKLVFPNTSRILQNATLYNGNASEYDWVMSKGNILNTNDTLIMTLTESNGGTLLSTTRYVHYGTITAKLRTGRWAGVVTAFITMSDIKDEIDWEFPGFNTTQGQTNLFWEGIIPAQTQGEATGGIQDTYSTYHDYTVDWTPEALSWLVDGKMVRTVYRNATIDSSGVAHFPSTPSRVQISLWPAGINSSAPGTIAWADGMINWTNPDYLSAGYFYAEVESVTIQCGDPITPGPNVTSYVYQSKNASNPAIGFSNASTLLSGAKRAAFAVPGPVHAGFALVAVLIFAARFI
ncbi:glycoside hydrolase family 16 protein [Amanita rubescens]|nr:glycoside hydrolase family 16 protein [Amanita rubescens]